MLGSQVFELGPFNIPVWLVAAAAGYALSVYAPRLFFGRQRELLSSVHDALSTGLLVALAVWKLTPLVTRFSEISSSPLSILYYPGGIPGVIAGLLAGLAAAVLILRRKSGSLASFSVRGAVAIAGTVGLMVLVPVAVVMLVPADGRAAEDSPGLDGYLEAGADRPVVLVFWATWCGPCTAQMPEVQRFHDRYGGDVDLLAVNLTATEGSVDNVREYLAGKNLTLPVVYDSQDRLRTAFGVSATPTTIILGRGGDEQSRRIGAVTAAWIERRVLPLL